MKDIYTGAIRNIEVLRDMIKLLPKDILDDFVNAYGRWCFRVDNIGRLHIVQPYCSDRDIEYRAVMDIAFEGDGIVVVSLCDKSDGEVIIRELYDDHCLDKGARLHRYLDEMNPRSRKFHEDPNNSYKKRLDDYFYQKYHVADTAE